MNETFILVVIHTAHLERKGTEFSWLVVYYENNWLLTDSGKFE